MLPSHWLTLLSRTDCLHAMQSKHVRLELDGLLNVVASLRFWVARELNAAKSGCSAKMCFFPSLKSICLFCGIKLLGLRDNAHLFREIRAVSSFPRRMLTTNKQLDSTNICRPTLQHAIFYSQQNCIFFASLLNWHIWKNSYFGMFQNFIVCSSVLSSRALAKRYLYQCHRYFISLRFFWFKMSAFVKSRKPPVKSGKTNVLAKPTFVGLPK